MLYLAELLLQDTTLRFGYADDICLYRAIKSLNINVALLAKDVRNIMAWGADNKIAFALEKLEMIHITIRRENYSLPYIINDELIIYPITTALKEEE